jgi:hypothetical protein
MQALKDELSFMQSDGGLSPVDSFQVTRPSFLPAGATSAMRNGSMESMDTSKPAGTKVYMSNLRASLQGCKWRALPLEVLRVQ